MRTKAKPTNAHGQRKPRRPRWAPQVSGTMNMVRLRATRATDAEIAKYLAPIRAGYEAMRQGAGHGDHYRMLVTLYFFATALETTGGIGGLQDSIEDFARVLEGIERRHYDEERGTWRRITLTAQELASVRNTIELHDTQLLNCTWAEFEKARDLAKALCRSEGGTVRSGEEAAATIAKVLEGEPACKK